MERRLRGKGSSSENRTVGEEFESPAVRQLLQDVLEFGRFPKETYNPKSESAIAEQKLAKRVRHHNLRDRAKAMLETHRFVKCHLNVF